MRSVILYIAMSLDGYIADREGGVDWLAGQEPGQDMPDSYSTLLERIDTVLLGWNTYHQLTTQLSPEQWPYEGLDCCETARRDGDASPDGLAHGFEGAESPEDLVAPPDDDPDSEPVPHLPPQLKALEWLDTMGSPDDVPPIDR